MCIRDSGQNRSELQNYGGNLRVRVGLGGLALHSITGLETVRTYSRGDIDGGFGASFLPPGASGPGNIPFASESADGIPKHSQFTQEFRLESDSTGALSWQAGVFAFRESYKIESFSYDSLAGGAQDGYLRVKQDNDAYAIFGNVNLAITPDFKLRGGLRYTRDSKTFQVEDYSNSGFAPCVGPNIGAIPVPPKCTLAQLSLIHIWGHAMAIPRPGVQRHPALLALRAARGRVRFAHADLAGCSVFEEAFTAGCEVAGHAPAA